MSMSHAAFENLLAAFRAFHDGIPALGDFAAIPGDAGLEYADAPHAPCAAMEQIINWQNPDPLHRAFQAVVPYAKWKCSYDENDVGAEFLRNYGYVEIYGPDGHFRTDTARGFIGYWGRGLYYPWHDHEPEEIYAIISGEAYFESEGVEAATLKPGDTRVHASYQRHAMTTHDSPILALAIWRGDGLADRPKISETPTR